MKKYIAVLVAALTALFMIACDSQEFVSAKMYVQQGDLEQAEKFFLAALELEVEAKNALVPFLYARDVLAKQDRHAEMVAMLDEALRRNPKQKLQGHTVENLAENLRRVQYGKEYKRGAKLYNDLIAEAGSGELNEQQIAKLIEAKEHFLTAILILPDESDTYTNLVLSYRRLGDKEGELAALATALEKNPENGKVLLLAGEAAWEAENIDEAVSYYEQAHKALPEDVAVMQRLTQAYLEIDNLEGALVILQETVKYALKDPDMYYNIGAVYASIGNNALKTGQDLYREAISSGEPSDADISKALADFVRAQEAYSEALYFMDNTLALSPDDAVALQAVREIQTTKRVLDTLQRAAEGMVE